MEHTSHLEGILKQWKSKPIANWYVIQDNIAQITLVDGGQFVLKQLGVRSEEAIRRIPLIFMDFFLQNDMPALIKVEFDMFVWLVRHRQEIIAQLETK